MTAFQRVFRGVFNRVEAKIHVQCRPVGVSACYRLDIYDLADPCLFEPGKLSVGQKMFLSIPIQPDAMTRYIRHFNFRSALSSCFRFHLCDLRPAFRSPTIASVKDRGSVSLSISGSIQYLASPSAQMTWICILASSREKKKKRYPLCLNTVGLIEII